MTIPEACSSEEKVYSSKSSFNSYKQNIFRKTKRSYASSILSECKTDKSIVLARTVASLRSKLVIIQSQTKAETLGLERKIETLEREKEVKQKRIKMLQDKMLEKRAMYIHVIDKKNEKITGLKKQLTFTGQVPAPKKVKSRNMS